MCMSSPKIPPAGPPPQESKQPESMAGRRNRRPAGGPGGTLLTGPSGIASKMLTTGGNTLLGG